jgi:serine/threonine-protein kinase RsbW
LSAAPENGIVSTPKERVRFPTAAETNVRLRDPKTESKPSHAGEHLRPELLLRLHLESNPEALCLVRATIQSASEVMRFPEPHVRAIVRSVDEALANVVRHAYAGRPGMPIEVTCRRLWDEANTSSPCGLEIELEDSGTPADPEKLRGRSLEEVKPGGLGLHFIRTSMDVVEFGHKNGKNLLRMVKYLAPPKSQQKLEGE